MGNPEYSNLTELMLNVVRVRPGMYLGTNQIIKLPNFIIGYHFRDLISEKAPDFYFGENGFLTWYVDKFKLPQLSFWECYFMQEANDNEEKAIEIYFERLEQYYDWYKANYS